MDQVAHKDIPKIVQAFVREVLAESHGGLSSGPMSALLFILTQSRFDARSHLLSTPPIISAKRVL